MRTRSSPCLKLRAHHVGCSLLEIVTHNSSHPTVPIAAKRLVGNPHGLVQVKIGPDDICTPCPHWTGGVCDRGLEALNRSKDERFLALLGLQDGEILAGEELIERFCARADRAFFREVCEGCSPDACADAVTVVARSRALRPKE
jgi:hypothetical protein